MYLINCYKNTRYLLLSFIILTGCGKELPLVELPPSYTIEKVEKYGQSLYLIEGIVNDSLTLSSDKKYLIKNKLTIGEGGVLSILAGTTVYAEVEFNSFLVIERGSKILAKGTADAPIVFTSLNTLNGSATYGDWGGIHINGQAIINERVSGLTTEIGKYGRLETEINDDDSGLLTYVRVEYAGKKIGNTEGALNLNGLGSKTTIDYVQTYYSNGHGLRVRGGTVNISHIMSTQTKGNAIRWDNGWTGNGQFLIAHYIAPMTDTITMLVGGSSLYGNLPVSKPNLSNITLIGRPDITSRGVRLFEGTQGSIYNMVVTLTERAIRADNAFDDILARNLVVKNSILFNNAINYFENSTSTAGIFAANDFNNAYNEIAMNGIIGGTSTNAFDTKLIGHSFFKEASYIGAILNENFNWTSNWSKQ